MDALRKNILLFCSMLLLVLTGCKEDEPYFQPGNSPEFYTTFYLNGERVEYTAGEEPYYMKSGTRRDEHGVYSFIGELSDFDCSIDFCPASVRFVFRDDTVLTENSSNIEQSLIPGVLPVYTPNDSLLSAVAVAFSSSTSKNQGIYDLNWDLGNGETAIVENPETQYTTEQGVVDVVCKTQDHDSGTVTTNVLSQDFTKDCSVDFTYQFSTGQISALNTKTEGQSPFTFEWDFGFGFMSLNDQPPLDFSGSDTIYACLRGFSADGCVSTRCKTLLVNADYDIAVTDYEYSANRKYEVFEEHFGEFTLVYVDPAGKVYDSRAYEQPEFSRVEVIDVAEYSETQNEMKTRKVVLEFELRVFGESEVDFLDIKNGKASIAVAYP